MKRRYKENRIITAWQISNHHNLNSFFRKATQEREVFQTNIKETVILRHISSKYTLQLYLL